MRITEILRFFKGQYNLTLSPSSGISANRNLVFPDDSTYLATLNDLDQNEDLSGAVPWSLMPFQNTWVKWTGAGGYGTPSYRKFANGQCELKGIFTKASAPSLGEVISQLPISCQPTEGIFINCTSQVGGADSPGTILFTNTAQLLFRTGGNSFLALPASMYGVDKATGVFFGDSNTYANFNGSAVSATQRFSYLISQAMGINEDNEGMSGTLLQNTSASSQPFPTYSSITNQTSNPPNTTSNVFVPGTQNSNGYDSYGLRILSEYPDYVFIMYGLNDMRWNGSSLTTFSTQLDTIVADLIKKKINSNRIYLANVPYVIANAYSSTAPNNGGSNALHLQYNTAIQNIARKRKCKFADVYTQMLNNGGDTLVNSTDYIHANPSGHVQIQTAFTNATIPT